MAFSCTGLWLVLSRLFARLQMKHCPTCAPWKRIWFLAIWSTSDFFLGLEAFRNRHDTCEAIYLHKLTCCLQTLVFVLHCIRGALCQATHWIWFQMSKNCVLYSFRTRAGIISLFFKTKTDTKWWPQRNDAARPRTPLRQSARQRSPSRSNRSMKRASPARDLAFGLPAQGQFTLISTIRLWQSKGALTSSCG